MKTKVKEIDIFLHEGWEKSIYPEFSRHPNPKDSEFTVKAKLIIELPEKKIEISESEFDKLWLSTPSPISEPCHETVKRFKQKLFGKGE